MTALMSAVVELKPDIAKFKKETVKGVEDATKDASEKLDKGMTDAGKKAGKKVGDGLADGINPDKNGRLRDSRGRFIKGIEEDAEKAGKAASSKFAMSWDKVNSIGNKMTVGVTLPVVAGFGMAIKSASDLGETVSATGVIFGAQSKAMQEWGDNAINTMGLAKNTALSAANTFGGMFNGMGMSSEKAAEMAKKLVERGRDIKSLYNAGSTEEVLQGLRSAMAGETEPLRRFGINITQAKIEAEALSSGLVKAEVDTVKLAQAQARSRTASEAAAKALRENGAASSQYQKAQADVMAADQALQEVMAGKVDGLNDQQKAQAILNIIMRESAVTEGDYTRTQDSTANKMEKTREQVRQLAATYGEKLLPMVGKVLGFLSGLIDKFNNLSPSMQNAILIGAGIAALIGPVAKFASAVKTLVGIWNAVRGAAISAAAAQEAASAAGGAGGMFGGGMGKLAGRAGVGLGAFAASKAMGLNTWESGLMGAGSAFGPEGALIAGAAVAGGRAGNWMYDNNKTFKGGIDWLAGGISGIIGMAEGGTVAEPGLSWVGEKGPELRFMPKGATVIPARESAALAAGAGAVTNITMNVRVEGGQFDERLLAQHLDTIARRAAATNTRTSRAVR